MKRSRVSFKEENASESASDNDAFDDGDDLMARAASMMDFNDEDDSEDDEDDSAAGGDSDAGSSQAGPSTGKKQKLNNGRQKGKKHADLEALPEDDEAELQSVLQLKIDALLSSVRCPDPSGSKARPLNNFVDHIRSTLLNADTRPPLPAQEAVKKLKAPLPFSDENTDLKTVNWHLGFEAPSKVQVCGSWPAGLSCKWKGKTGWNIDLIVQMPGSLLQEKDVKDSRYFYKRAYYLSALRESLEASSVCESVSVSFLNGNRRKPILEVTPKSNDTASDFAKLRCALRVIPVFDWSDCPFGPARLGPARSNLRVLESRETNSTSSPVYNSDVASDGSPLQTSVYMDRIAKRSEAFSQAALLLKTWALQRNLAKEYGLSHCLYLLTTLLAYVLDGTCKGVRTIPAGSGAWQAFKACLDCLARTDLTTTKLVSFTFVRHDKAPTVADWQTHDGPVLVDPTGVSNLFSETPMSALELLRYEAKLALRILKRGEADAFEQVLLRNMDHSHIRFDQLAKLIIPTGAGRHIKTPESSSRLASVLSKLASVLKHGLGSRARAISLVLDSDSTFDKLSVHLGLYLEPAQIQRLVEYGPPADNGQEVRKFRELWGSKAETRKFRDGRILESVVWDADGPEQRSKIFMQVVRHLVLHHFGVSSSGTHFFATAYDKLMAESPQVRNALYNADPQSTGFSPLTTAFDDLVKELKELKDLPLQITNVIPVSEGLRYTSTFVPGAVRVKSLPHISTAANHLALHDCHIVFETSGKWPEDVEAIQKIKAAFLARLAQSLPRAIPGCRCEIQLSLTTSPSSDNCHLGVILPEGFAFRIRVHQDMERKLLEDVLIGDDEEGGDRKASQVSLIKHHKRFTALPDHHGAIRALQARHATYSTTVRITKRWLAAHCLAIHMPTELIELIAAHVYLDVESPYEVPSTGVAGFARVLQFLSQWQWREQPLLVPIFTAPNVHEAGLMPVFPEKQRSKAMEAFATLRKADPTLSKSAWFVATEKDVRGRTWGEAAPTKLVAGRVQELARVCSQVLAIAMQDGNPQVQHLFIPDLEAFDFVLHLKPAKVSNHLQAVAPSSKDLAKRPDTPQTIRPGFNIIQSYLQRLQDLSGDIAVFFYDHNGGVVIGGLFNPTLTEKERAFRIALDFPTAPSGQGASDETKAKRNVRLDKKAFLDQLVSMSDGLVERISVKGV